MEDFINRVYTISAMESFGVISTQRVSNGLAPLNVFSGSTTSATTAVTTAGTTAGAATAGAAAAASAAEIDLTSDNEQPDNISSTAMTAPLSAVNAAAATAALSAGTVLDLNASSYYENGFDFEEPEIMEVEDAETEPTALEVAQAELAAQQAAAHNTFTAYMQAVNSGAANIADAGAAAAATAAAAASAAASAAGTKRARGKQPSAKRSSSSDAAAAAAPTTEPASKRRKSDTATLRKNAKEPLEEHVRCCIECEEEGELAMCTKCPRVYHFHCLLRIDERCSELTDITQLPDPWYCPRVSAY
jgi:trimeric autotransporter adhesin